jgi:hypothetical protein
MAFDNPQALASHQDKFCIHSKYADLDSLTQQYDQIKGNPKVKQSYFRPPSNHLELKASQQYLSCYSDHTLPTAMTGSIVSCSGRSGIVRT